MKAKDEFLNAVKDSLVEARQSHNDEHGLCDDALLDRFMQWLTTGQAGEISPLTYQANQFIEELNEQALEEGEDA